MLSKPDNFKASHSCSLVWRSQTQAHLVLGSGSARLPVALLADLREKTESRVPSPIATQTCSELLCNSYEYWYMYVIA